MSVASDRRSAATSSASNGTSGPCSSGWRENWSNKGSSQNVTAVGYTLLTAITAISAAYVRMKYTINGSGKAIVALNLSAMQL